MKKSIYFAVLSSVMFFTLGNVEAKIIYYGSQTEKLTVVHGNSTLLRFDEEVKTISQVAQFKIEPADNQNPNYRVLSITPRNTKAKDSVTFILSNDQVISLEIETVDKTLPGKSDQFYDFKTKENSIDPTKNPTEGSNVSELELMKAMIRNDKIVGYESKALIRPINSGQKDIVAKLIKVYIGPKYTGYVFSVQNESKEKQYAIDLKSLTFGRPNTAILSYADHSILETKYKEKSKTLLHIVTKPTSVYYAVTLPLAPLEVQ